jgi:hypothetical protein
MSIQDVISDTSRIQQLAVLLPLEEVEKAVLAQIRKCASRFTWGARYSRVAEKQEFFSELVTSAYNLTRVLEADPDWYQRFDGVLFEREEGEQHPDLAKIFETVLTYAFAHESQRWRKHAVKLAASFRLISGTGLAAEDVVRGLERVIAYEKLS